MRPRLKLRWAMLAVAVSAVLLGPGYRWGLVLRSRMWHYREMAIRCDLDAKLNQNLSKDLAYNEESRARRVRVAAWYRSRRDLYQRAARFPLFEVPVEWEPEYSVPYRWANGRKADTPDPALMYPKTKADEERSLASILNPFRGLHPRR